MDLLLKNIGLLATPTGTAAVSGAEQKNIKLIENAMVGVKDRNISYVGTFEPFLSADNTIDCEGALVTPGLVDAHTHLVFGGWRQNEFPLKLAGVPYLEILRQGGGILNTVNATRSESEDNLIAKGKNLLDEMLCHGTTTVECKSGYGLNLETELKQLRVTHKLGSTHPVDTVATFMGAHAVAGEYSDNREAYIRLLCDEIMPAVADEGIAEFCDIFCELSVFSPDESRMILTRAAESGFKLKIHADEINPIGGAELSSEMGCISAEHLIESSDEGIRAMAEKNVIAVLLPTTSFYLGKPYARARTMVKEGVAVAVATDFNPGSSPNLNLQLSMNLACLNYRLTPSEVLTAVTLNAAAAINRAETIGSIEPGKKADLVIWNAPDLDMIFYRFGSNQVKTVIKNGICYQNKGEV